MSVNQFAGTVQRGQKEPPIPPGSEWERWGQDIEGNPVWAKQVISPTSAHGVRRTTSIEAPRVAWGIRGFLGRVLGLANRSLVSTTPAEPTRTVDADPVGDHHECASLTGSVIRNRHLFVL